MDLSFHSSKMWGLPLGSNVLYFFYFDNYAQFHYVDARWQNALAVCAGPKLILGKRGTHDS